MAVLMAVIPNQTGLLDSRANQTLEAVTETTGDDTAWVDRELWMALAESVEDESFYEAWLDIQCRQIPATRAGLILAETQAEKTFAPAAVWPESWMVSEAMLDVARSALEDGEATVIDMQAEYASRFDVSGDTVGLAFPLKIQGKTICVAAVEVGSKDTQDLETLMRQLQWGVSWLEAYYRRFQDVEDEATIDRLVTALYMTAAAATEESAKQAVTRFVTEMATRLDCERVSCGFVTGRYVKVASVSHTGQFGRQMNLVNAIGKAMDEAVEQNQSINYPEGDDTGRITHNHEVLSRQQNGGAILTVPLVADGRNIGALTVERSISEPFDPDTVQMCESIASIVGPIFREKKLNDRWIGTKIKDSVVTQLGRLIGPRYIGRKVVLLMLIGIGVTLYYARGDFNITADTVLEGAYQRAVVTPYDGYVQTSVKRIGDRVTENDIIATLDDTDLRLDLVELTSGKAQALSQYDEAVATYDRAKAKVFKAKIEQAEARISLVDQKLNRTTLRSPLDGIIVKGDLSQSLGAAVSRGEVLFEIASLNDYRVNLQVDERDISYIQEGQPVELLLSALPDERIAVTVETITPVTRVASGRNLFRVEASLADPESQLRPGMEGVAKIRIGQQRYVWIWTRELFNWIRLWSWRWAE